MKSSRRQRLILVVLVLVAAGSLAYVASSSIGDSLVYYWGPSELLERGAEAEGASVRLGGLVVPGSIVRHADGLTLEFEVTDTHGTVPVFARTVPPAMFREGIGVVVEGNLRPDGVFDTKRLMVKHDNEYQAPGTEDERSLEELAESLQIKTTS